MPAPVNRRVISVLSAAVILAAVVFLASPGCKSGTATSTTTTTRLSSLGSSTSGTGGYSTTPGGYAKTPSGYSTTPGESATRPPAATPTSGPGYDTSITATPTPR